MCLLLSALGNSFYSFFVVASQGNSGKMERIFLLRGDLNHSSTLHDFRARDIFLQETSVLRWGEGGEVDILVKIEGCQEFGVTESQIMGLYLQTFDGALLSRWYMDMLKFAGAHTFDGGRAFAV
jgi:hypothetical protein